MKQFFISICKNLPAYGCRLYSMRYYKSRSKVFLSLFVIIQYNLSLLYFFFVRLLFYCQ